ncbi:MAG TPA: chorismate synthase, partial [Atribacteraceae bacterium]|nr:chorismate synthase [Atribacteraceae bacterium]
IPTLQKGLKTVDLAGGRETLARYERSDICAVPRALAVAEAMLAWELAVAYRERLGGDSMEEILLRHHEYGEYLEHFLERSQGDRPAEK